MRIKMANGGMNDVPERTTEDPSGRKIAAPDRIWISTPSDPYVCDFAAFDEPCDDEYHEDIEYVRADLYDEMRTAIRENTKRHWRVGSFCAPRHMSIDRVMIEEAAFKRLLTFTQTVPPASARAG